MSYEHEFAKSIPIEDLLHSANICELLHPDDVKYIGNCALDGYNEDKESRREWEKRNADANKLALQVVERKSFPWDGAANVKFPLITVAALQYQARAYPSLIDTTDLVKCMVYGLNPSTETCERAERVSAHMTWQNIEQDECWEEEHDKALLVQAIAGDAFIKTIYDSSCGHNVTTCVMPGDFVVNYWTRSLDASPRYTHVYNLSEKQVRQREVLKIFCAPYENDGYAAVADKYKQLPKESNVDYNEIRAAQDKRQGLTEPPVSSATPYLTGEQYCWWDLDGDDFPEPYIVTFDIGTGCVRRIVARYLPSGIKKTPKGEVYEIEPISVFTKIPFIPSPDGGFYDLGLGALLGPINESVNTAINQIFDAGTMSTLGGGFVGRGFRARGGPFTFRPFEWQQVDSSGDDIRKNVLPLPVKEPSSVLFQLAQFLIGYGERVASANEIQMGENVGQNTPAETARTMNENGARIYAGIYKRTWRAFRDEFRIQYDLNKFFLPESEDYVDLTSGAGAMVRKDDYSGKSLDVRPAADPHVVSDTQRIQQATMLVQASGQLPGFNRYQTQRRWLKAQKVVDVDQVMPPPMTQGPDGKPVQAPDFQPPPDPKMLDLQIKQRAQQLKEMEFQQSVREMAIEFQMKINESNAKTNNLNSQAQLFLAQTKSEAADPAIKLIYAEIESEGAKRKQWTEMLDIVTRHIQAMSGGSDEGKSAGGGTSGAGMGGVEAPASNAAVLGTLTPGGQGIAGSMAGGGVSIQ